MSFGFQTVLERELRAASRRSSTYWTRFQMVAAAMVPLSFLLLLPVPFASAAKLGEQTFLVLSFLAFLSTLIAAVRLTADCVSSEKREGTLGFLFLTDLKASDIVIGKLAATSLSAAYGLLALVPVMAVPILSGGVSLWDVLRFALVLFNSLFFALSLGMLISALSWTEKKAVGLTSLLLFGGGTGLLIASQVYQTAGSNSAFEMVLRHTSPVSACFLVMSSAYQSSRDTFWSSTAITHALGWGCFLLTCRVLPHVWQDRPSGGWLLRWREWSRQVLMGSRTLRTAFRRRLLGVNPIFWLASREQRTWWYPWIFLGAITSIAAFTCWGIRARGVMFEPLIFFTFMLHAFLKHWMASEACYAFSTDRDRGALELLLSTPLDMKTLIGGHWLALQRRFLAPILLVLAVEFVLIVMACGNNEEANRGRPMFWLAMMLCSCGVFVADVFALIWVGWWSGVVAKNASAAVTATYLRLMLVPWMVALVAWLPIAVFFELQVQDATTLALFLWVITSLAADLFFGHRARHRLFSELRPVAVERYGGGDPSTRWWRKLGRSLGQRFAGTRASAPTMPSQVPGGGNG